MNSAAKNHLIAMKQTNFTFYSRKILRNLCFHMSILRSFFLYNLTTNAVRKILIAYLKSISKNTSIERKKTFILG